jgi:small-conductance mechanosensitive channel
MWLRMVVAGACLLILLLPGGSPGFAQQGDPPPPAQQAKSQSDPTEADRLAAASGLAGGIDLDNVAKVEEAINLAREQLGQVTEDDPRKADRKQILELRLQLLGDQLKLLGTRKALEEAKPLVGEGARKEAEVKRDKAVQDLTSFVASRVEEDLRGTADVEAIQRRIKSEFQAELDKARSAAATYTELLAKRQADLAGLPGELEKVKRSLLEHQTRLGEYKSSLQSGSDLDETSRNLLERRVTGREIGVVYCQSKTRQLEEQKVYLEGRIEILKLEEEAARRSVDLASERLKAAEGFLQGRLNEESAAAKRELERKQREVNRQAERYEQIASEEELNNLLIDAGNKELLSRQAELVAARAEFSAKLVEAQSALDRTKQIYADLKSRPSLAEVKEDILNLEERTDRIALSESIAEKRDELDRIERFMASTREQQARDEQREQDAAHDKEEGKARENKAQGDKESEQQGLGSWPGLGPRRLVAREAFASYQVGQGATPGVIDQLWQKQENRWKAIESSRTTLLEARLTTLESLKASLKMIMETERAIYQVNSDHLQLLRRENLFLRGESKIDWQALERGIEDLKGLPASASSRVQKITADLIRAEHRSRVIGCLVAIVFAFLVFFFVYRWLSARIAGLLALDLSALPVRTVVGMAHIARGTAVAALLFFLFFLPSRLMTDLDGGVAEFLRDLGLVLGGFWFFHTLSRELFRPEPASRAFLGVDPVAGRVLGRRIDTILLLSLVFMPLEGALKTLGSVNEGALELLDLVHKVLIGMVLLTLLARRHLLLGLLPSPQKHLGRFLRFLVSTLHPIIVLLVPVLLFLTVLRYEILVGFITGSSVLLVAVTIGGNVIYYAAVFFLERWLAATFPEGKGGEEANRSRATSRNLGLFLAKILAVMVAFWALLLLSRSTFGDVKTFLEVDLPFQGLVEKKITWWNVLMAGVVLTLVLSLAGHVKAALRDLILPRTKLEPVVQYTITMLVGYFLAGLGAYLALTEVFNLQSLGYVVAALSVGIGFGLQEIVSNFVSGLILLLERPLRVGDIVQVGETEGIVEKINIRATTLRTRDNVYILVPNRDFVAKEVTNFVYTDPRLRLLIDVGVAYGSDTALVRRVLLDVADQDGRVLARPAPDVYFQNFGDSSLDFRLLVWISDSISKHRIASDLRFAIDAAFRRNGIQIPFPQRDLHLRTAEAAVILRGEALPAPEEEGEGEGDEVPTPPGT